FYQGFLIKVNPFSISAYDLSGNRVKYIDAGAFTNSSPQHGFVDAAGVFWIADANNGLVKSTDNGNSFIYPNGPFSINLFSIASLNGRLWAAGGAATRDNLYTNTYSKDGIYFFKDNQWKSFNRGTDIELDTSGAFDFLYVAIDPNNPDHAFSGSW